MGGSSSPPSDGDDDEEDDDGREERSAIRAASASSAVLSPFRASSSGEAVPARSRTTTRPISTEGQPSPLPSAAFPSAVDDVVVRPDLWQDGDDDGATPSVAEGEDDVDDDDDDDDDDGRVAPQGQER